MADRVPHQERISQAAVVLVSAHFYADYQSRNLQQVRRLKAAVPIARHVAVLNVDPLATEPVRGADASRSTEWLSHNNDGHDFGAFQRGLTHLLHSSAPDWVLFMNDTIGTHANLPRIALQRLARTVQQPDSGVPSIVGFECYRDQSFEVAGYRSNRWMRSHFFAVNRSALRVLDDSVRVLAIDKLVCGGAVPQMFFDAALDYCARERIAEWLFDPTAASHWYRAAPLALENCDAFAHKARAILQEYYLSLRLDAVSARFVDLCPPSTLGLVRMKLQQEMFFRFNRAALRAAK